MFKPILMEFSLHFISAKRSSSLSHLCVVLHVGLSAKFTKKLGLLGPHPRSVPDGLFRQSLNGTGNGNLINTNGILDIILSFHTATGQGTGTGQGQGT